MEYLSGAPRFYVGSCFSIFSSVCSLQNVIVCLFVLFRLGIMEIK
jgi:hypothetical protein